MTKCNRCKGTIGECNRNFGGEENSNTTSAPCNCTYKGEEKCAHGFTECELCDAYKDLGIAKPFFTPHTEKEEKDYRCSYCKEQGYTSCTVCEDVVEGACRFCGFNPCKKEKIGCLHESVSPSDKTYIFPDVNTDTSTLSDKTWREKVIEAMENECLSEEFIQMFLGFIQQELTSATIKAMESTTREIAKYIYDEYIPCSDCGGGYNYIYDYAKKNGIEL